MVASADPVDDELVIDGEIPMVIRTEAPEGHPFDEVLSGWLYRTAETRALEADSFANPAMLYVEPGEAIWNTVEGAVGNSCPSCHGDAEESMAEVGATYPQWDAEATRPVRVELQINDCCATHRQNRMRVA